MAAVSASDVLTASGIRPGTLDDVLPDVDASQVGVRVAPGWFRAVWIKGIAAVALPWGIYVQPAVMTRYREQGGDADLGRLMVHELTHIQQWRRLGALRHVVQYGGDYVRGRFRGLGHWEAYRAVRLEVEARQVADQVAATGLR